MDNESKELSRGGGLITILTPVLKKTNNTVLTNTSKNHVGTPKHRNSNKNENRIDLGNKSITTKFIYTSTSKDRILENNHSANSIYKIIRTNTSMTLNCNNKEVHNKPTIHHTFTTVNLHNKNQPKVIMSNANKRSSYRTSTSNSNKQTL